MKLRAVKKGTQRVPRVILNIPWTLFQRAPEVTDVHGPIKWKLEFFFNSKNLHSHPLSFPSPTVPCAFCLSAPTFPFPLCKSRLL